jgi:hypothetical protein
MPEMDCWETSQAIRQREKWSFQGLNRMSDLNPLTEYFPFRNVRPIFVLS